MLRLNNPPINAIGFELPEEFVAALDQKNAEENVLGIIVTGTNSHFSACAYLVVEVVFEDVAVKRPVMSQIEAVCQSDTIIASSTPTIDLDELARNLAHPRRLIGLHVLNLAHSMPLV